MAEQVIREYILKTDQFKSAINDIQKEYADTAKDADKATNTAEKGFKEGTVAAKQMDKAVNQTNAGLKNTQVQAQKVDSQFTKLTASVKSLGAAVGLALGAQEIIRFTKEAIDAASDLGETTSKAGELFGASLNELEKWAAGAAQSIGQSQKQALDGASTFAIFGRAAGKSGSDLVEFSTGLTELASDLASFNNTTPEDAIQAIGAALRGEAEPIRRYGVLLDDATLKQEALELGIISTTKQALTPQQKVLAAQAAIFKQTAAAQGDFARTSDQLANQQRILAANVENLQAELGKGLLPVTLDIVRLFNGLATGDLPAARDAFVKVNQALNPLGLGLGGIVNLVENLRQAANFITEGNIEDAVKRLGSAFLDLQGTFNPVVGAFRLIGERLFETTDDLKNAELEYSAVTQGVTSILSRQNQIYADLAAGKMSDKEATEQLKNTNIALDVIYKNISSQINITRADFDKYVAKIKEKTKATELDNNEDAKKLTALQAISKELAAVTERIQTQILLNGSANQKEVERYTYLTAQLNRVKEGIQDINDRAKPITLDPVGIEESQMKLTDYAAAADEAVLASGEIAPAVLENIQQVGDTTEDVLQSAEQNALDVLSVIGNTVNQIGSLINQVYDQQQQAINDTLQTEINAINKSTLSEEAKQAKIDALQKKAAKEQYDLQVEAFKVNQALQIVNTVISTAQAVISGLAAGFQAGGPAGIALGPATAAIAAALGAVQIGIIASQKPPAPPAFAKGTDFVQRGKNKPGIDTIPAYLNEGEAVIPTDKNKQYPGLAKAWIGGKLESYVNNVMLAPKIAEIERKAEERWMSKLLEVQGEKYDDMRLFMATTEGNMYLRSIAKAVNQTGGKKRTYNA